MIQKNKTLTTLLCVLVVLASLISACGVREPIVGQWRSEAPAFLLLRVFG